MEEKILQTKKNGMTMLLLTLLGYVAAVVVGGIGFVMLYTTFLGFIPLAIAVIYAIIGIFLFAGLKVLKPEEALVLTLFGDYIGTLKGEGFYWVNPFCTAVNPAAGTVLSQSGDVQQRPVVQADREKDGKKISLKVMTLNNSRQKINDCLGNPVEIGIAVIWRVTDTAKAVFNVDNYKEYLSLQCDSALRNVVRIYPYDVAPKRGHHRRRCGRRGQPARLLGSGGKAHPGRDPEERHRRRDRDHRSPHHLSGLRPRDRGGHAAASAGKRHH